MKKRLLLLGGGHANLPLLAETRRFVENGAEVTLLSDHPTHYYSGMGPGMLGGQYEPAEIRFPVKRMIEEAGGSFVHGRAVLIDPRARTVTTDDDRLVEYDLLCCNTGSSVAATIEHVADSANVVPVKPIASLVSARGRINAADRAPSSVVVIGGGPAAVEVAGNVASLLSERVQADERAAGGGRVTIVCGRAVLPGFPRRAERLVVRALTQLGIEVRSGVAVRRLDSGRALLGNGTEISYELAFQATGVIPSSIYRRSRLPVGPDGSLAVNESLQALGHPEIFGGGDCIWFTPAPLPRAGVFAVRQGPVLVHNVAAALSGSTRLRRFSPGGDYLLLLNMGDGTAILRRRILGVPIVVRNRFAWRLKDRIDRAFMKRFGSEALRGD